jgi:acetylornithine deacetylase
MKQNNYAREAAALLAQLIAIPSVSRDEKAAADLLFQKMEQWQLSPQREGNNVWAVAPGYDEKRQTVLLNAHIDTVKPVATWTRAPFTPEWEGDRLYGLGSNDCCGGLVSLLQAFRILSDCRERTTDYRLQREDCRLQGEDYRLQTMGGGLQTDYNLVFLASCEEEVSGSEGIVKALPLLPHIDVAIVGEPTGMQPAVAEKGLMVIDGYAHGVSGHAAREEGVNAIYEALDDLLWLRDYRFEKVSELLGPAKMTVTVVEAGTQHNVVPDTLHFIIDVRPNEFYQNEEIFQFLCEHMKKCELKARSFRLHSSSIAMDHPLVRKCLDMGLKPFGSPTLSDQALMPFASFKLGPGQSSRSHSADEFICLSEIEHAINTYLNLLSV